MKGNIGCLMIGLTELMWSLADRRCTWLWVTAWKVLLSVLCVVMATRAAPLLSAFDLHRELHLVFVSVLLKQKK